MTLPASTGRRQVHLRRITCTGFQREDGLWDIEGRLTDTKPEAVSLPEREVAADEAIHDMLVCLTIDREFVIRAAWARTLSGPYRVCGEINASYGQLVGVRIEPGFTQNVKRLFRGVLGCTHLTELLPPMATTAYQVLWTERSKARDSAATGTSPLGGCHALRLDGEVVRLHFSEGFGKP
jgi:hypothetical protein